MEIDSVRRGNSSLVGENVQPSALDLGFQAVQLLAYKYTSLRILCPFELIEDSPPELFLPALGAQLGERIARAQGTDFTTGSGAGRPWGIVGAATVGVTAASATAFTGDEVVRLIHSVDPNYRRGPSSGFMMHENIFEVASLLKDGAGRYLWTPPTTPDAQDLLHGRPVFMNNAMASSVATGATTMLFGQFSAYKIRDTGTIRLSRTTERRADNDEQEFIAFLRSDGLLADAGTHPVKKLVQA